MKYLLHSRKFRNNLYKWLFCYLSFVALFTVVVTYSRYITQRSMVDSSRPAKFDVYISDPVRNCSTTTNVKQCGYDISRTQRYITYEFIVDTTNLEVSADFVTTITSSSRFSIYRIYIYNSVLEDFDDVTDTYKNVIKHDDETGDVLSIAEEISSGNGYERKYRVIVEYKDFSNPTAYATGYSLDNAFKVGYSAIQIN